MQSLAIKKEAWDQALHAEGTRDLFQQRASKLEKWTKRRDFLGLAVPIVTASLLASDLVPVVAPYKNYILPVLSTLALAQLLVVTWSLLSRWDSEFAYDVRAAGDSYDLREAWRSLAKRDESEDLNAEYGFLRARQTIVDSDHAKKGMTRKEQQRGMRSGLIEFQGICVCGNRPSTLKVPRLPKHKCVTCGGN